jgi:prevent-host-death family protein
VSGGLRTAERFRLAASPSRLLDMLDAVETAHAAYRVTRDGHPVAVVLSVPEYEQLVTAAGHREQLASVLARCAAIAGCRAAPA